MSLAVRRISRSYPLVLDMMFHGGRLFVGAVSALFLKSRGLDLDGIAVVKGVQVGVFLLLDIPLGILISRFGSFFSLIVATALGLGGAVGYLASDTLSGFLISEICLAISLSIWPVAFGDFSIQALKLDEHDHAKVDQFFHLSTALTSLSILCMGLAGSYMYKANSAAPYLMFSLIYLVALVSLLVKRTAGAACTRGQSNRPKFNLREAVRGNVAAMLFPLALVCCLQYLMQPLLHYWQLLFSEVNPSATPSFFGWVFFGYCLGNIFISYVYSKLATTQWIRSFGFLFFLFSVSAFLFFGMSFAGNIVVMFGIFVLLQGIISVLNTAAYSYIQKKSNPESRAIIHKFSVFVSRLGMAISLLVIRSYVKGSSPAMHMRTVGLYRHYSAHFFVAVLILLSAFIFVTVSSRNRSAVADS